MSHTGNPLESVTSPAVVIAPAFPILSVFSLLCTKMNVSVRSLEELVIFLLHIRKHVLTSYFYSMTEILIQKCSFFTDALEKNQRKTCSNITVTCKLPYINVLISGTPNCTVYSSRVSFIDVFTEIYLEINLFSAFIPEPIYSVRHISQINIYWTKNEQTDYCITGNTYITLSWEK